MDAVPSEGCGNFAYERAGRRSGSGESSLVLNFHDSLI